MQHQTQKTEVSTAPHLVRKVASNPMGRDLIVGDVHGCFTALQAALDAVGFTPDAGDRLFSVGDLVDRGTESEEALEWLAKPWMHAVRGNHEAGLVDFVDGQSDVYQVFFNGGAWFLGLTTAEQREIAEVFRALPLGLELETSGGSVGLVHADITAATWRGFLADLTICTPERLRDCCNAAVWSRDRLYLLDESGVPDLRALVVGHTTVPDVVSLGNVHYIDTGGWSEHGGVFTVLDAATLAPAIQPRAL